MDLLAKIEIGERKVQFGAIKLSELTAMHIAMLRDARLAMTVRQRETDCAPSAVKTISGATVNRVLNLLSHVFSVARREWKWISDSPIKEFRRPKATSPRDRRPSADEIERLCLSVEFCQRNRTEPATAQSKKVKNALPTFGEWLKTPHRKQ